MQFTDQELMLGLSRGESQAYTALYDRYMNQLFYFVNGVVKDPSVAEDIVAECFIKVWKKAGDFHSLPALKSFLMVSGKNAAIDHLRMKTGHTQTHEEIRYLGSSTEKDVEEQYIASELLQLIRQEIDLLPPQCRQVMQLYLLEGLSNEEIAERMNLAYKSVQNQKTKGLKLLRNALIKSDLMAILLLLHRW